jgi:hypothetical protein
MNEENKSCNDCANGPYTSRSVIFCHECIEYGKCFFVPKKKENEKWRDLN